MVTVKRHPWVKPGQQWSGGETYEQYVKAGKPVASGYTHPEAVSPVTPAPTPTPTPTPTIGRELPFPTTQAQMAEYQATHTFTGGKWYKGKEAVTPTPTPTPTPEAAPEPPVGVPEAPETDTTKIREQQEKTFTDLMEQMEKTREELSAKQEETFKKIGETATTEMTEKFEETQKGIMDAYQSYFDQQADYLKTLQEQPSAVEQLQKFREEQGLPQMEQQLAGIDQTILDTEGLLTNLAEDIRTRTEGLPVSEAAARRLEAMEAAPISKRLTELIRGRARVAAGLEAKERAVGEFMTAQQADIERQRGIAEERLGFARERAEVGVSIQTQSFDLFRDLQDKMLRIDEMRLDVARDEAGYKNELAKMGFDYMTQIQAQQVADIKDQEAFERELIKIQLEKELEIANPDVKSVKSIEDREGNVSQVITYQDGTTEIQSLGRIGKGEEPTTAGLKQTEIADIETQLLGARGTDGFTDPATYQKLKTTARTSPTDFDNRFGHLLSPEERVNLGIEKEPAIGAESKWEQESVVWQWIETDEAKALSEEEKASQIRNYGLNPETFGIY